MKNQIITLGGAEYVAPALEIQTVLTEEGMAASFETPQEDSRTVYFE